jgi:hypothetical protein
VPHELLRNRNFSITSGMASMLNFSMVGMFLPFTIFLQAALGFTAIKAGLVMLPMSLASRETPKTPSFSPPPKMGRRGAWPA